MSKPTYPGLSADPRSGNDVKALVETARILTGAKGNDLDRAITLRMLSQNPALAKKIGVQVGVGTGSSGDSSSGGGSSGGTPNVIIPPLPTNLVVTAGFNYILLDWDEPGFIGYAYTEIWRNTADNFTTATKIATCLPGIYADPVSSGVEYFYWIRFRNIKDQAGPINQTAGTKATAHIPPSYLLDRLSGQLSETQLHQDLNTRINLIDAPNTGLVSKTDQLQYTQGQQALAISATNQIVSGPNGLTAMNVIKTDVNGHVSGYGLYNDGTGSAFLVSATRFGIASPGATTFTLITENGKVVMDGAAIKNASVESAAIKELSVDKLTGVTSSWVVSKIGAASITNAMIGNVIQSNDFNLANKTGWQINKNGTAIFNNVTARGNITADALEANKANIVQAIHIARDAVVQPYEYSYVGNETLIYINAGVVNPTNPKTTVKTWPINRMAEFPSVGVFEFEFKTTFGASDRFEGKLFTVNAIAVHEYEAGGTEYRQNLGGFTNKLATYGDHLQWLGVSGGTNFYENNFIIPPTIMLIPERILRIEFVFTCFSESSSKGSHERWLSSIDAKLVAYRI